MGSGRKHGPRRRRRQAFTFLIWCQLSAHAVYGFGFFSMYVHDRSYVTETLWPVDQVTVAEDGAVVLRLEASYSAYSFVTSHRRTLCTRTRYLTGGPDAIRHAISQGQPIGPHSRWGNVLNGFQARVTPLTEHRLWSSNEGSTT